VSDAHQAAKAKDACVFVLRPIVDRPHRFWSFHRLYWRRLPWFYLTVLAEPALWVIAIALLWLSRKPSCMGFTSF
jgi:hypothetical protein